MGWVTIAAVLLSVATTFFVLWQQRPPPPPPSANVAVVAVEGVTTQWISQNELQVRTFGKVQAVNQQRLLLEIAICDDMGNRIPSRDSFLTDRALGLLQAMDVVNPPQQFEKNFRLQVPSSVKKGYASLAVFDHDNLLVAQQNSAFWAERR